MKFQKTYPSFYEIQIEGELGDMWANWFEGLSIRNEPSRENDPTITILSGTIADQPALYAVLNKIRDLNLILISVRRIARKASDSQQKDQNGEAIVRPRQ